LKPIGGILAIVFEAFARKILLAAGFFGLEDFIGPAETAEESALFPGIDLLLFNQILAHESNHRPPPTISAGSWWLSSSN
jgi:hypothetical protein